MLPAAEVGLWQPSGVAWGRRSVPSTGSRGHCSYEDRAGPWPGMQERADEAQVEQEALPLPNAPLAPQVYFLSFI